MTTSVTLTLPSTALYEEHTVKWQITDVWCADMEGACHCRRTIQNIKDALSIDHVKRCERSRIISRGELRSLHFLVHFTPGTMKEGQWPTLQEKQQIILDFQTNVALVVPCNRKKKKQNWSVIFFFRAIQRTLRYTSRADCDRPFSYGAHLKSLFLVRFIF